MMNALKQDRILSRFATILFAIALSGCTSNPVAVELLPVTAENLHGSWVKTFTKMKLVSDPSVEFSIPTFGQTAEVWEFRAQDMTAILQSTLTRVGTFSTVGDSIFIQVSGTVAIRMSAQLGRNDLRVTQPGFLFDFDGDGDLEDALGVFQFRRR